MKRTEKKWQQQAVVVTIQLMRFPKGWIPHLFHIFIIDISYMNIFAHSRLRTDTIKSFNLFRTEFTNLSFRFFLHTHTNILYIWLLNSFMFKLDVNNINRSFFGGVCTRYGSYPWANLLSGRMMYHYGWMTFMIIFVVFIFFFEFLTFFIQLIFRVGIQINLEVHKILLDVFLE